MPGKGDDDYGDDAASSARAEGSQMTKAIHAGRQPNSSARRRRRHQQRHAQCGRQPGNIQRITGAGVRAQTQQTANQEAATLKQELGQVQANTINGSLYSIIANDNFDGPGT